VERWSRRVPLPDPDEAADEALSPVSRLVVDTKAQLIDTGPIFKYRALNVALAGPYVQIRVTQTQTNAGLGRGH
jgi:hypothetical protein